MTFRFSSCLFLVLIVAALLTGCGTSGEETKAFVEKTKASKGGIITPLPKIQDYTSFVYEASLLKSPFQSVSEASFVPGEEELVAVEIDDESGVVFFKQAPRPDSDRQREFLESVSLETLTMVGTLSKGVHVWGLLVDKSGAIHRVRAGNYLGNDSGRIERIGAESIHIRELVVDGEGGWEERQVVITMRKK
jgi:type IV pilus assembly protein PilP